MEDTAYIQGIHAKSKPNQLSPEDFIRTICSYCGSPIKGKVHMDHVDPTSRGGADSDDNKVPACGRCNTSKSDKPLLPWLAGRSPKAVKVAQQGHRDDCLERRSVVIYFLIERMSRKRGYCTPGRSLLAEMSGYTESVVAKTLSDLMKRGYIDSIRRACEPGGKAVAHYMITREAFSDLTGTWRDAP